MSFKAKTVLNKDIRVFKQDIDTMEDGLEAIKKFIKEKYNIQGGFIIQYEDEEKDVITVASSEDLEEAYHQAESSGNVLKLIVVPDNGDVPVFEFTSELDKSALNEPKQSQEPANNNNNNNNESSSSDEDEYEQEEETAEENKENPCYISKQLLKDLIENKEFRKDFINFIQQYIKLLKQDQSKNMNDVFIQTLSNYKNLSQHPSIKKLSELFPFLLPYIEPFLFLIHTIDVENIGIWINGIIELLEKFDFNNQNNNNNYSHSWLSNIIPMIFGHGGFYGGSSSFFMPPPPPPPPHAYWYGQGQGQNQGYSNCCNHGFHHGRKHGKHSPQHTPHHPPFGHNYNPFMNPFGNFFMPPPPPPPPSSSFCPFRFGGFGAFPQGPYGYPHPHSFHHGPHHGPHHHHKHHGPKHHGHHGRRFGKGPCHGFEQMFNNNNNNNNKPESQEQQGQSSSSPWCNIKENKCEWKKWCKWNKKCGKNEQVKQENEEYNVEILNDNITLMDKAFVLPNQVIIKTWHVKNNGKQNWPSGMKLKYYGKLFNPIINGIEFNVPELKINEEGDISVIIETPKLENNIFGKQKAFFRLHLPNNQGIIGPIFRVRINIINGLDNNNNNNNNNVIEEEEKKNNNYEESDVIEQLKQVYEQEKEIIKEDNNNKIESSSSSYADINIPKIEDIHMDDDHDHDNEMMPEPIIPIQKNQESQIPIPVPQQEPIIESNNNNNNNNNNYVYQEQLNMLLNMGFNNIEKICQLLNVHHGDVNIVINQLFA